MGVDYQNNKLWDTVFSHLTLTQLLGPFCLNCLKHLFSNVFDTVMVKVEKTIFFEKFKMLFSDILSSFRTTSIIQENKVLTQTVSAISRTIIVNKKNKQILFIIIIS